jgi:signal transduction histidine kinase
MKQRREFGPKAHAAKVAAVATLIVAACYLVGAVVMNVVVVHRLNAEADGRLGDRLSDASVSRLTPADEGPGSVDEAPTFLWKVGASGAPVALTPGAPALPRRSWGTSPVTMSLGGSTFRVLADRSGSGWLVAASSTHEIDRVRTILLVTEAVLGGILVLGTFGGAFAIGLRAIAPVELMRRRQAEFTADASHELRTPLSVIQAEVDLALARPRDPAAYRATLERVRDEARRLEDIVNDLLWLARADATAQAPDVTGVDVAAVAQACVSRFAAVAAGRHVALAFSGPPQHGAVVRAPEGWIDRLVGVLVDNACRYAAGGSVDVGVALGGNRVVLRVDDSGPGVPEELRSQIFDRFHRATAEPGGTGLGLAIADSVVRATHGTWHVGTSPAGGARFEVTWRRTPPPPPAPRSQGGRLEPANR